MFNLSSLVLDYFKFHLLVKFNLLVLLPKLDYVAVVINCLVPFLTT